MNFFEKILYMLQMQMETPKPYGWFHLGWVFVSIISIIILSFLKNKKSEKVLKSVLVIYGIIALLFEVIKQLIWSFNYDAVNNIVTWDYQWYAAPFQLCTTPIFICIICLFLKNNKLRDSLLSYMSFITILGSFMTMVIPDSCFVSDTMVNIHTMWLHCGSFVVSMYLLISGIVKINKRNFINAFIVFLVFVFIAEHLNIIIYNLNILHGETFNMFYISPYFKSELPIFDVVSEMMPYIVFLLFYIFVIAIGSMSTPAGNTVT